MRLHKPTAAYIIAFAGLLFCAGNLWFTLVRSTIPIALDAVLVDKIVGREKHPGTDDVHWLILENGERFHVDESVFNALSEGERLQKSSWSGKLRHGNQTLQLECSRSFHGMLWTMGIAIAVVFLMTMVIRGRSQPQRMKASTTSV